MHELGSKACCCCCRPLRIAGVEWPLATDCFPAVHVDALAGQLAAHAVPSCALICCSAFVYGIHCMVTTGFPAVL
jgi:hypothetical protein